MYPRLSLLFLPLFLAGCSTPPASVSVESPCDVDIPVPQEGSLASYMVQGAPWSMELNLLPIVDWSITNGGARGGGTMVLPPASQLTLEISPASDRLTRSGQLEPAYGLHYAARRPGDADVMPFADAWLAQTDGATIQATLRNIFVSNSGQPYHDVRFTHEQKPAAFGSQMLWGKTLTEASHSQLEMISDQPTSLWNPGIDRLTWSVESTGMQDGRCRALVQIAYVAAEVDAALPDWSATATYENGTPFPIEYQATPSTLRDPVFRASLQSFTPGPGAPMPQWKPELRKAGVPLGAPDTGMLSDTANTFATPWTRVIQETKNNVASRSWFNEHPNAVPVYTAHILGEPDSQYVDAWRTHWTDGAAGNVVIVEQRKPLLVFGTSFNVISTAETPLKMPSQPSTRTSLSSMAAIFEQATSETPEVLNCNFELDYCGLGTHIGTAYPRYNGTWPSSSPHIGLLFDITDGVVLTDQSASNSMLKTR